MKMSSFNMFKSSENIQKEEGGPDRTVLDNQSSSVKTKALICAFVKAGFLMTRLVCNLYLTL